MKLKEKFLKVYRDSDFVLQQKVIVVFVLYLTTLTLLPLIFFYSLYLQEDLNYFVLGPLVVSFLFVILCFILLIRGYFSTASHAIFIIITGTSWVVLFMDRLDPVTRLDSIVYVIGLLTLLPLLIRERRSVILLYTLINIIILILFVFTSRHQFNIPETAVYDYLADNIVVMVIIGIVSYNVFNINRNALKRAHSDIEERKKAEASLYKKNEELSATMEELEATNEEFEAQNIELLRANKELEMNEERYRSVFENSGTAMGIVNNEGIIEMCNSTFEKISGYGCEEVENKLTWDIVVAEDQKAILEEYRKARLSGETAPTEYDTTFMKKSGEVLHVHVKISLIPGTLKSIVSIEDITERVRAQEMLIENEKILTIGGLAAGMAHEINNPLGIILQGIQVTKMRFSQKYKKNQEIAEKHGIDLKILDEFLTENNIHEYLNGIGEAATRAAKIISDMLFFSRSSDASKIPIKLNEIIERAISMASHDYDLKKKYDFRKIEIVRNYERDLRAILCFEGQIEQVVINLLKNSAQAMNSDERDNLKPIINIKTWQDRNFQYFSISDNGPGMGKEIAERIFDPFFTTKPSGVGTGLGLSVSYYIIKEKHDGLISVESKKGEGSTFTVRIPVE